MKRFCRILALTAAVGLAASGLSWAAPEKQGTFEFYIGKYEIKDPRFTAVYEKGDTIRGLVVSSAIFGGIDFYTEIKAFFKTGALTYTKEKSKFALIPLSLGLRYVVPGSYVLPYGGGGVDFCFYYENNPLGTVINVARGYHILGGIYLQFGANSPLRLNAKVKYTWARATENDLVVELGGLEYGGGIAIVF
jgi:hypothetical protein